MTCCDFLRRTSSSNPRGWQLRTRRSVRATCDSCSTARRTTTAWTRPTSRRRPRQAATGGWQVDPRRPRARDLIEVKEIHIYLARVVTVQWKSACLPGELARVLRNKKCKKIVEINQAVAKVRWIKKE